MGHFTNKRQAGSLSLMPKALKTNPHLNGKCEK